MIDLDGEPWESLSEFLILGSFELCESDDATRRVSFVRRLDRDSIKFNIYRIHYVLLLLFRYFIAIVKRRTMLDCISRGTIVGKISKEVYARELETVKSQNCAGILCLIAKTEYRHARVLITRVENFNLCPSLVFSFAWIKIANPLTLED